MQLRLPGGTTLKDFLLGSGRPYDRDDDYVRTSAPDTARQYDDVSAQDVSEAVDLLGAGDIEFIGLIDVDGEVQAAEEPGDRFVFERSLWGSDFQAYPELLDLERLRGAFLAFHAGDTDAGLTWPDAPAPPAPKKRGLFGRKR